MDCACEIEAGYGEAPSFAKETKPTAKKEHVCSECGGPILPGEQYERVTGKYDGDFFIHKICPHCLSIIDVFFCSFCLGCMKDEIEVLIDETKGEILDSRILKLTQGGREKVFKMIEDYWEQEEASEASQGKGVCPKCGKVRQSAAKCGCPWTRITKKTFMSQADVSASKAIRAIGNQKNMDRSNSWGGSPRGTTAISTVNWGPGCDCGEKPVPALVLDPFSGAGTTCRVAERLGRRAVGVELNPDYIEIAKEFCGQSLQPSLLEAL
jgi:hypothetical protein